MHGARYTNFVLEESDLLVVCGARFDDRAIGKAAEFCPNAQVVHIDIDDSELHKIRTAHVGIQGDVATVLALLLPQVQTRRRHRWLSRVADLRRRYPLQLPGADDPAEPYGLIRCVARLAGDSAIVTTDVGQHQMWVAQAFPFTAPRRWLTSGGLGTMGFGLPAAIGAAMAAPERTVLCFSGDGSLQMNIQELTTAVEENLNVKIILLNNSSLGLVHQQQELFYGKRVFASDYRHTPNFCRVAEGFGIAAYDLTDGDPEDVLETAIRRPGPCLVNVPVDVAAKVYPMVPPGAANRDMIGE
jgi:acetolactate synthase-1/2/3 large subunit